MATASLSASARTGTGKGVARSLRRDGRVPAVIYGHARASQALSVDARELSRLLDRVSAETTVIELAVDGTMSRTLIRDIQRHPVKRAIIHVDFQELVAGELVTVNIPIVITGTSIGAPQRRHPDAGDAGARVPRRPGEHPEPHRSRCHQHQRRWIGPRQRPHDPGRGRGAQRRRRHGADGQRVEGER
ncbi:MAG: 50S ribosomal protein L25 [Gemmatimonadetes bacterium]|nr:50S ribosomal protein L25 [Gemmatimonadota bacterium]